MISILPAAITMHERSSQILFRCTIFWEIFIMIMSEESVVSLQFPDF
jgi:hypothetical protein